MTFRRALFLSLLVLIVSCVGRAEAAAAAPNVSLVRGALQVQTVNGLVFTAFRLRLRLRESGDFGAWLERAPSRVEVDGRALPASAFTYAGNLLRVPAASFGERAGEREVRIVPARTSR